jgi:hypothetical protein
VARVTFLRATVLEAATPEEALRASADRAESIHLLVTDVIMRE